MRRVAVLIALIALTLTVGCSQDETPLDLVDNDPQSAASRRQEDPLVGVQPANVTVLTPAEVRETLGETFPIEVPVPKGEFLKAESHEEAWNYTVVVSVPTDGFAAWYRDAYVKKNWEVVSQAGSPDGAYVMNLYKGGATSEIRIIHAAEGSSRAEVSIGVAPTIIDEPEQ